MIEIFEKNLFHTIEQFSEEAISRYIQSHNDFENIHVRLILIQNLGKYIYEHLDPTVNKQILTDEASVVYQTELYAFTREQFQEAIDIISEKATKKLLEKSNQLDGNCSNTQKILKLKEKYSNLEDEYNNLKGKYNDLENELVGTYNQVDDLGLTVVELHETISRLQDAN